MSDATDSRTPDRPTDDHLFPARRQRRRRRGGRRRDRRVRGHRARAACSTPSTASSAAPTPSLADALDRLAGRGVHPDVADEPPRRGRRTQRPRRPVDVPGRRGVRRRLLPDVRRRRAPHARAPHGRKAARLRGALLKERNRTHGRPGHEARPEVQRAAPARPVAVGRSSEGRPSRPRPGPPGRVRARATDRPSPVRAGEARRGSPRTRPATARHAARGQHVDHVRTPRSSPPRRAARRPAPTSRVPPRREAARGHVRARARTPRLAPCT